MALASPDSPRRSNNLANSCAESILARFPSARYPRSALDRNPIVKNRRCHSADLKAARASRAAPGGHARGGKRRSAEAGGLPSALLDRISSSLVKRRGAAIEPSNADLVYEVLRSAERPLTLHEISERVNARRLVTTAKPLETIRGALSQGQQLVSLGDGRYGYLPHVIEGSLLRLPLTHKKPANHLLVFPDEVRQALFPSWNDIQKRRSERPALLGLSNGVVVELALEFLGTATWGSAMPDELRRYL